MLSITCLNFKYLRYKIMRKNKFINRTINNIRFKQNLTYILITLKAYSLTIRFSNLLSKISSIYILRNKFHRA